MHKVEKCEKHLIYPYAENFTTFVVYDWFEEKVTLPAGWLSCSIQEGVDRCFDPPVESNHSHLKFQKLGKKQEKLQKILVIYIT